MPGNEADKDAGVIGCYLDVLACVDEVQIIDCLMLLSVFRRTRYLDGIRHDCKRCENHRVCKRGCACATRQWQYVESTRAVAYIIGGD